MKFAAILLLLYFFLVIPFQTQSKELNGFELQDAIIPAEKIFHGGPPKDGIPSIDYPQFNNAADGEDDQRVLGIYHNKIARAYPINILNWHEVVNDVFGDDGVVITYCPLCGSGVAFLSDLSGERLEFGVSGLLYNSDVLLYDRNSSSLWSQLLGKGVTGNYKGTPLTQIPIEHTSWKAWKGKYPDSQLLIEPQGFTRDYSKDPYRGYQDIERTYFPVEFRSAGLHPKELVIGIEINGQSKAYPFSELMKTGNSVVDKVAGQEIVIIFNQAEKSAVIQDKRGKALPATTLYWFAWSAFHPDTMLFSK